MSAFSVKIHGAGDLKRAFEALPARVQKQVARKALRPGATLVSRELKKSVPTIDDDEARSLLGPGRFTSEGAGNKLRRHLSKGIQRRNKTYTNTGTVMVAIGPRYDYRDDATGATAGYLAEQLELGDDENRARPFLRPTAQRLAAPALASMIGRAREVVNEEAAKLARSAGGRR